MVSNSPQNLEELLIHSTNDFAEAVKQSFADMIGVDMSLSQLTKHTGDDIHGITIYSHFIGAIQGMFLINLNIRDCNTILNLDINGDEAEGEIVGFLKECLNVAAGMTLPKLEAEFGQLTYSPSVYINGKVQFPDYSAASACLQNEDGQSLFSSLYLNLAEIKINTELNKVREKLSESERNANVDSLTKVFSRSYFDRVYDRTIGDCHDRSLTLSLIWIDVDKFKDYNDTYGHQVGDLTLELIGSAILGSIRNNDLAFRYGGDEFIVLLPSAPPIAGKKVAESIAQQLAQNPMVFNFNEETVSKVITLSMGVATLAQEEIPKEFLKRADSLLYVAKEKGRNVIVSDQELLQESLQS